MANDCCNLVGNLELGMDGCITSVNTNCSTEMSNVCGEPLPGATIGTVSLTGYADTEIHTGCAGRASVSIPWIRKYDCKEDTTHFLFAGEGQASTVGPVESYVELHDVLDVQCTSINASSSSGPATIYTRDTQYNGYGMTYNGTPIPFSTTEETGVIVELPTDVFGPHTFYLQNFNLTLSPGQFPVATYSIVYSIDGAGA